MRVSAPGYGPRSVRLSFRTRIAHRVPLWRPALQWPMYGVNPARTQAHTKIRLRPRSGSSGDESLYGLLEFPAMVWEGVAYVNNIHGWLRALSMKNGRLLWKRRVGTLMASSPGIDPKRRLLVTTSMAPGYVNVVDMDTGRRQVALLQRPRGAFAADQERGRLLRHGERGVLRPRPRAPPAALGLPRRRQDHRKSRLAGGRLYFGDYAGRVFA